MSWRRVLPILCMLAALAATVPAAAQEAPAPTALAEPASTATPEPTPDGDGDGADDGVLQQEEIPPESTPDPPDEEQCTPGPGADGSYVYCDPCPEYGVPGADADYEYCLAESPAGGGGGSELEDGTVAPPLSQEIRPVAPGRLPLTGSEPLLLALFGLGFLLAGAGTRLLLTSAGRPR